MKKYLSIFISLLYLELVYQLFLFGMPQISSIFNIVIFSVINTLVLILVTSFFDKKSSKIIFYVYYVFLAFWYSLHYIFYKVFLTPFTISLFNQADQVIGFNGGMTSAIIDNFYMIILFLLPLIFFIIFKKKIIKEEYHKDTLLRYFLALIISIVLFLCNILIQGKKMYSSYDLLFNTNNETLNIKKFGVPLSTIIDFKRTIFGFDEKISNVSELEKHEEKDKEYGYNVMNIDLNYEDSISKYLKDDIGTQKNKYTGYFKDKNLIFIVAESFSEIGVKEDITPTLYKLVNNGFVFENFYTSNNLSTIGGEFQAITGLYADNSILSIWREGKNYYPFGLGTMFKKNGYNVRAYHNNSAFFQDRNVYLKSQGFDSFKACNTGLEKLINCKRWPASDIEMIDKTTNDYLNSDEPFMTYYMTVSGHFAYTYSGNSIASKNKKYVKDLNYPEAAKAYLATQIELDKALELLLQRLEEKNKLDDTVIVLLADHYPYKLDLKDINALSNYERDEVVETNSNNLIIYNSKMDKVNIKKTSMAIDVIPTVYNLFGMEYDSRLFMGKDILSNTSGIAFFKDKSWVTDKGTYFAATNKFVGDKYVTEEYINNINTIVNNRVIMSKNVISENYYNKIMNK